MLIYRIIQKISHILRKKGLKKKVGFLGNKCSVSKYYCIEGQGVHIGDGTVINEGCWIKASIVLAKDSKLIIGKGCNIGRFNEIYSTKSIILEDKVLTAERVYISDNLHGYADPEVPIMDQPIVQNNTVTIGEGSWIGAGVAIMGANIGKHCVIGANAVVTHDIPDYSIAVGIPAKVIKKYDFILKKWVLV